MIYDEVFSDHQSWIIVFISSETVDYSTHCLNYFPIFLNTFLLALLRGA